MECLFLRTCPKKPYGTEGILAFKKMQIRSPKWYSKKRQEAKTDDSNRIDLNR
jgi:hypothetical protein